MGNSLNLLVFRIEDTKFAIGLEQVDRVVRAATLKPIPGAPPSVLGVLNYHGVPIPVISLRRRLNLADKPLDLSDEIIIFRRDHALFGILVDDAEDVTEVDLITLLPESGAIAHISGALKLEDGLVLVQDIDKFLSFDEEFKLSKALFRSELG